MNEEELSKKVQGMIESGNLVEVRNEGMLSRWMKQLAQQPRCSCCGATTNLQSGYAAGNLIWQCPGAASEASARGM